MKRRENRKVVIRPMDPVTAMGYATVFNCVFSSPLLQFFAGPWVCDVFRYNLFWVEGMSDTQVWCNGAIYPFIPAVFKRSWVVEPFGLCYYFWEPIG